MKPDEEFACRFHALYREIYRLNAKRLRDLRDRPSTETLALLSHLAQTGPLSLTEMTAHLARAPSTLSVKVAALEAQGLLSRQPDARDGRSALIWLSQKGHALLDSSTQVLDESRLATASAALPPATRARLLKDMQDLMQSLSTIPPAQSTEHPHEPHL